MGHQSCGSQVFLVSLFDARVTIIMKVTGVQVVLTVTSGKVFSSLEDR